MPVVADEPRALLESMAVAAREQSYQGDFVYERSGSFSTHRVWRQGKDVVFERLLRTDGTSREWLRRDGRLQCSSALKSGVVWLDTSLLSDKRSTLHQWYSLQVLGNSRVANRPVTVMAVKPRDPFRYAYELYLDLETGLLLQSLLINASGTLLERFQFTNLQVGPVEEDELSVMSTCLSINEKPVTEMTAKDGWMPAWLPPGFVAARRELRRSNEADIPVFTQVFTDGLARFTVFIEPLAVDRIADDLRAQLGPTVVISRRLALPEGNYLATVVGEVPPLAAERIAASLSPGFDPDAVIDTAR
jgi:sigma-E factor negative regulatory protein RseB